MRIVRALVLLATTLLSANTFADETCGDLRIPYPFGTTPDRYLNKDFFINCTAGSKPFLRKSDDLPVSNISIHGELWIDVQPAYECHGSSSNETSSSWRSLSLSKFFISNTKNKFYTVGCDARSMIQGIEGVQYATGCIAMCYEASDVEEDLCSGLGCCATTIPRGISNYNITVESYFDHKYVVGFNPCSYAFVVGNGRFEFSRAKLGTSEPRNLKFPVVLDWAIGNQTCEQVGEQNVCKSHSECYDSDSGDGNGYRCKCLQGYDGNPYLQDGCQDVNECENPELSGCKDTKWCNNLQGGFSCSCYANGTGCSLPQQHVWIKIVVGTSIGVTGVLMCITWFYCGFKKWKAIKLKEHFFKQNGGLMLLQDETSLIFTEDQLKKATNNFDETKVAGRGGFGTVFKGTLPDGMTVAIKTSKLMNQTQIEQFINEMRILSKINHRNVVKLLGFCLETHVPVLVYEFVSNGTLADHIHENTKKRPVSWDARLRIAAETAGVLSYLHSAASVPIIHRDVKTTNILLDEAYTVKVSDFGASRLVPQNQEELSTVVQGTIGYLDPEYMRTSQFTEKSDVYSFGVVLMELLTGQRVLSFERPEEKRSLVMYFLCALHEGALFEIVAESVRSEDEIERVQVKEVAELAKSCVRVKGEERPSMKEVAMELEGLRMMGKHAWDDKEETQLLLGDSWDYADFDGKGDSSSGYGSFTNHIALTVKDPR